MFQTCCCYRCCRYPCSPRWNHLNSDSDYSFLMMRVVLDHWCCLPMQRSQRQRLLLYLTGMTLLGSRHSPFNLDLQRLGIFLGTCGPCSPEYLPSLYTTIGPKELSLCLQIQSQNRVLEQASATKLESSFQTSYESRETCIWSVYDERQFPSLSTVPRIDLNITNTQSGAFLLFYYSMVLGN